MHTRRFLSLAILSAVLTGCGAVMSSPDDPLTVGGITPHVKDKDIGLVAVAPAASTVVADVPALRRGSFRPGRDRRR
jgi:hypothetical protein